MWAISCSTSLYYPTKSYQSAEDVIREYMYPYTTVMQMFMSSPFSNCLHYESCQLCDTVMPADQYSWIKLMQDIFLNAFKNISDTPPCWDKLFAPQTFLDHEEHLFLDKLSEKNWIHFSLKTSIMPPNH